MDENVKILYMSRTSKLTGPENILIDVIRKLDKKRFSPAVVLPDSKGPFFKKLKLNGIKVLVKRMPFLRVTYNPLLILWFLINIVILNINFSFVLKKRDIDIVVCNSVQEALLLFLPVKILKKKLLICFKNILDRRWKKKLRAGFCNIFASGVVAVSDKALEDYVLFADKNRAEGRIIETVYDGLDCGQFKKDFEKKDVIKKYRGSGDEIVILNIGNLTELKGQILLLEALNSGRIKNLDVKVLLLGDVYHKSELPYKKRIKRYILENNLEGKVFMLGYTEDVRSYLKESDIIVHCPIREDAFPRVILEAFCFEKIVIATRIGGIPEMVKDGYNGFLCDVDAGKLADKISYVCSNIDRLDYIGSNALDMVRKKFSVKGQVVELAGIYNKILKI
ncbi:MAG: glycosyltransferase family 4 protein [Actinomycetota bacterium]|nr:glycosyltransferase family 4 protein [Actinomycetota bacterium]